MNCEICGQPLEVAYEGAKVTHLACALKEMAELQDRMADTVKYMNDTVQDRIH